MEDNHKNDAYLNAYYLEPAIERAIEHALAPVIEALRTAAMPTTETKQAKASMAPLPTDAPSLYVRPQSLNDVAEMTGSYYKALVRAGIPSEEAILLVRDWHTMFISPGAQNPHQQDIVRRLAQTKNGAP